MGGKKVYETQTKHNNVSDVKETVVQNKFIHFSEKNYSRLCCSAYWLNPFTDESRYTGIGDRFY